MDIYYLGNEVACSPFEVVSVEGDLEGLQPEVAKARKEAGQRSVCGGQAPNWTFGARLQFKVNGHECYGHFVFKDHNSFVRC